MTVPRIVQVEGEECCWACTGTSICQYQGIAISRSQFIATVKGNTDASIGATVSEVLYGLSNYGLTTSRYRNSGFEYATLVRNIDLRRPVLGSGYTIFGKKDISQHMYVYTGYRYTGTLASASTEKIVYINDSSLGKREAYFYSSLTYPGFNEDVTYYSEDYVVAY